MNCEFNDYHYYGLSYPCFNNNIPASVKNLNNVISIKDGEIRVQPMWRMELLGKCYGIEAYRYENMTNFEYYEEVLWQLRTERERAKFRRENFHADTFDEYYEDLAGVAKAVGAERTEIKCLIKSLLMKYRLNCSGEFYDFPHEAFNKLYFRLISSSDLDQVRAAERLSRYHIQKLDSFLRYKAKERKWELESPEDC